jgi:hypothetical protein
MAKAFESVTYPGQLELVPGSARVTEEFGWTPANLGAALLLFSSLVFTQPAKPTRVEWLGALSSFLIGILLLVFDFWRRKRPRVLARLPEKIEIGVYKRGTLVRTAAVQDLNLFLRHPGNTWGPLLAFGMTAILFGAFAVIPGGDLSRTDRIYAGLASLLSVGFFASAIKTRLFCEVCLVPYLKKRTKERIMIPKKAIRLLFSRPEGGTPAETGS